MTTPWVSMQMCLGDPSTGDMFGNHSADDMLK